MHYTPFPPTRKDWAFATTVTDKTDAPASSSTKLPAAPSRRTERASPGVAKTLVSSSAPTSDIMPAERPITWTPTTKGLLPSSISTYSLAEEGDQVLQSFLSIESEDTRGPYTGPANSSIYFLDGFADANANASESQRGTPRPSLSVSGTSPVPRRRASALPQAPPQPTLRAYAEEKPVPLEFAGTRYCPLVREQMEILAHRGKGRKTSEAAFSADNEEDINQSPFKSWDFVPFLRQAAATPTPAAANKSAVSKTPAVRNTLCLDLDETLVHTSSDLMADADAIVEIRPTRSDTSHNIYVKYRPFLREFLAFAIKHFEVVIFTASKQYYARAILARLQADFDDLFIFYVPGEEGPLPPQSLRRSGNCIVVLHRDHCTPTNAGFVKDLFLLGRDLRKCLLIDNLTVCGSFQPFNFIHVKDFARCETEVVVSTSACKKTKDALTSQSLKELKGFKVRSSAAVAANVEVSYAWEDTNDDVLLQLISLNRAVASKGNPSAYRSILAEVAATDDIAKCLFSSMMKSKAKATKQQPTAIRR